MSRSKWKGPFMGLSLLKKISVNNTLIWSRASVISSAFIGKTVFVYNGKEFKRVLITREKVGYKFGEFSFTKKHVLKLKLVTTKKNIKKS
jgi:small subunit ribosomal protein S19